MPRPLAPVGSVPAVPRISPEVAPLAAARRLASATMAVWTLARRPARDLLASRCRAFSRTSRWSRSGLGGWASMVFNRSCVARLLGAPVGLDLVPFLAVGGKLLGLGGRSAEPGGEAQRECEDQGAARPLPAHAACRRLAGIRLLCHGWHAELLHCALHTGLRRWDQGSGIVPVEIAPQAGACRGPGRFGRVWGLVLTAGQFRPIPMGNSGDSIRSA